MRFLTPKDVGGLIREARNATGMTQTALGDKIGASRYWVADVERGKSGAEFGLVLKALRALKLVFTVEPKEEVVRRAQGHPQKTAESARPLNQPTIDLAATLSRTTIPTVLEQTSDPFKTYGWQSASTPTEFQTSETRESRTSRNRKRSK